MKEPNIFNESVPDRPLNPDLKAMAVRQQQQIDTQHQLLVAKEQRLRFLKQQEARSITASIEGEKLHRLRERVEAQESKLRRLRALRGQVDLQKTYNLTLSNDLDSIRALFSEKEKELSVAVAKVEALTRQLEELKRDKRSAHSIIQQSTDGTLPNATRELEKLRRELMYRNQLSLQQDARLHLQREALQQRQAELHSVDQRILELQDRLNRKKASNLILLRQDQDVPNGSLQNHVYDVTSANSSFLGSRLNIKSPPNILQKNVSRGNIAAIEPYNHVPNKVVQQVKSELTLMKLYQNATNLSESDETKVSRQQINVTLAEKKQESASNTSVKDAKGKEEDSSNPLGSKPSLLIRKTEESQHHIPKKILNFIPSGNLVAPPRTPVIKKPISSVAPTAVSNSLPSASITPFTSQTSSASSATLKNELERRPALPPKPTQTKKDDFIVQDLSNQTRVSLNTADNLPIKAKPLTIKKQPLSEQPKLKSLVQSNKFVQNATKSTLSNIPVVGNYGHNSKAKLIAQGYRDETDRACTSPNTEQDQETVVEKSVVEKVGDSENAEEDSEKEKSPARETLKSKLARRVSFDPLALLLDASLEGELELVKKTAVQVTNPSAANDEGITALHNAICAGHFEIVKFLVEFGCDVNAQDSDGWSPLHCASSCNHLAMVKFLVESGACLFATTLSDHETPAEKCEEDEEGFDGCSEYLYNIQEKLGTMNNGQVHAVFSYDAINPDELSFTINEKLTIIRKGDEVEKEWWYARNEHGCEGYVPRNLLGLHPRVMPSDDKHCE